MQTELAVKKMPPVPCHSSHPCHTHGCGRLVNDTFVTPAPLEGSPWPAWVNEVTASTALEAVYWNRFGRGPNSLCPFPSEVAQQNTFSGKPSEFLHVSPSPLPDVSSKS